MPTRRLCIVTGVQGAGKTTILRQVADILNEQHLSCIGVVQPAVFQAGRRTGYTLEAVGDDAMPIPLARRRRNGRGYDFLSEAFTVAAQLILQARRSTRILVVDELGWLEAEGGGHWPALLEPVEEETARVWLLGVRRGVASILPPKLGAIARVWILPADADRDGIAATAMRLLEEK